ncbi:MAG: hypothetical protein MUP27_06260, partial [Desulfobacterales bacterium]|nr:hypothetical protein [Desulfobacterales bacterium]
QALDFGAGQVKVFKNLRAKTLTKINFIIRSRKASILLDAESTLRRSPSKGRGLPSARAQAEGSKLILSGAFDPVLKDGVWRRRSIKFGMTFSWFSTFYELITK